MHGEPGAARDQALPNRDLIRRDRREQAALRLRSLLADGLESGEGQVLDDERVGELRELALGPGE